MSGVVSEVRHAIGGQWTRLGRPPIGPPVHIAQTIKITKLVGTIVPIPVGPPPSQTKPVMGAASPPPQDVSFPALEAQVGGMLVHRTYSGTWIPNFANTNAWPDVAAGRWSIYSFHDVPSSWTTGSRDAEFNAFLASIPAGHKTTIVYCHEPESKISSGAYTLADWQAAQLHLAGLVHAAGRPELTFAIVLMNFTWLKYSGRNPNDYWPASFQGKIDFVGCDAYQPYGYGSGGINNPWTPWATSIANFTTWIKGKTTPLLTEYACYDAPATVGSKVTWLQDVYAWAKANGVAACCYFDVASGSGMSPQMLIEYSPQSIAEFSAENTDSKT